MPSIGGECVYLETNTRRRIHLNAPNHSEYLKLCLRYLDFIFVVKTTLEMHQDESRSLLHKMRKLPGTFGSIHYRIEYAMKIKRTTNLKETERKNVWWNRQRIFSIFFFLEKRHLKCTVPRAEKTDEKQPGSFFLHFCVVICLKKCCSSWVWGTYCTFILLLSSSFFFLFFSFWYFVAPNIEKSIESRIWVYLTRSICSSM